MTIELTTEKPHIAQGAIHGIFLINTVTQNYEWGRNAEDSEARENFPIDLKSRPCSSFSFETSL